VEQQQRTRPVPSASVRHLALIAAVSGSACSLFNDLDELSATSGGGTTGATSTLGAGGGGSTSTAAATTASAGPGGGGAGGDGAGGPTSSTGGLGGGGGSGGEGGGDPCGDPVPATWPDLIYEPDPGGARQFQVLPREGGGIVVVASVEGPYPRGLLPFGCETLDPIGVDEILWFVAGLSDAGACDWAVRLDELAQHTDAYWQATTIPLGTAIAAEVLTDAGAVRSARLDVLDGTGAPVVSVLGKGDSATVFMGFLDVDQDADGLVLSGRIANGYEPDLVTGDGSPLPCPTVPESDPQVGGDYQLLLRLSLEGTAITDCVHRVDRHDDDPEQTFSVRSFGGELWFGGAHYNGQRDDRPHVGRLDADLGGAIETTDVGSIAAGDVLRVARTAASAWYVGTLTNANGVDPDLVWGPAPIGSPRELLREEGRFRIREAQPHGGGVLAVGHRSTDTDDEGVVLDLGLGLLAERTFPGTTTAWSVAPRAEDVVVALTTTGVGSILTFEQLDRCLVPVRGE
jgi:hypothetical protein